MSSIKPFSQSHNLTHLYTTNKLCSIKNKKNYNYNSIIGQICRCPGLSKFKKIIEISETIDMFNNLENNISLFVTTDNNIPDSLFDTLDIHLARQIVLTSTLSSIHNFRESNAYYYTYNRSKIFIYTDEKSKSYVDNNMILKEIHVNNGNIIVISGLINFIPL